jgi:hypothetical protein
VGARRQLRGSLCCVCACNLHVRRGLWSAQRSTVSMRRRGCVYGYGSSFPTCSVDELLEIRTLRRLPKERLFEVRWKPMADGAAMLSAYDIHEGVGFFFIEPGIGNTLYIIQYIIQLIRILHNTGGWILYYFVLFGLQPEPEPEAAAAVCYHYQCPHVRVGLCGTYMCAEIQNDSNSHDR